jgi:hypothetical protein
MIIGACQYDGHATPMQNVGDRDYGFSSQIDIKKGNVGHFSIFEKAQRLGHRRCRTQNAPDMVPEHRLQIHRDQELVFDDQHNQALR